MNNGFPGSFTPIPNNMGLSCQPNFNGSRPGPCVLHHVNTGSVPVSNISRNVASVQNNQMDFRRVAQAQERHAMARFSQQQNSQIAAAKSITAMVARAAAQAAAKPAPKAAAKPVAKPVPKTVATPATKPVPKAAATPAAKPAPKAAEKPVAKPAPKIAEKPVAKPVSDVTPMLKTAANSANQNSKISLDSSSAASVLNINNPKINNQTSTNLSAKSPETINKTGNPLTLAVGYNFLSHTQLVLKDKELAECQTELCKIGKEAKWVATDLTQGISFGAGMIAGIPGGISDAVDGTVKMASSPAETFQALKSLGNSDNVLGNVSNAFKESWANSIDQMEAEFQKGGVSGAFNAGAEGGKIASDILANFTGIAGIAKTGTVLTEKLAVKVAGKAELVSTNIVDKVTVSNIYQRGVSTSIKSMQTGLKKPQQVDQIKNDMMMSNYRFSAPEGRIAGYIDSKGNYYISEGNHRMVAAQEIYKHTGDASYIDKLLQNGSWTQTKNAPTGSNSMPTRK